MTKGIKAALKRHQETIKNPTEAGTIDRTILDSPNLNYIFGGGFANGRIYELFGPESGGKSTVAWYIAHHIQRRESKNIVAFFDIERTFDKDYARAVGLDLSEEKLLFLRHKTGEEMFETAQSLMEEAADDIGLLIFDSVAAIPSARTVDGDYGKAGFGAEAALLSNGLKKLNPWISDTGTSLIMVNQVREDIGGFSPVPGMTPEKTPGGRAPKFYASWRGRVSRSGKDLTRKGVVVGNGIKVKNVKSKIGPPKRVAEMVLYYDSGFDTMDEYVSFIATEEFGLAQVKGAWIYGLDGSPLEGEKFQGRAKLRAHLEEDGETLEKCKLAIVEKFKEHLANDVDPDDVTDEGEVLKDQPTGQEDWDQF